MFHALGRTGMHYVTRRSHWIQKHEFDITCPNALVVESVPVPPEHEKWCIDVSQPGRTGMHYLTHKSHRMQKHKIDITFPGMLFIKTALGPHKHEK
jgi:hypothetical protein